MTRSVGHTRRAPTLRFLGGVRTVTGSRFLLDTGEARVLVDCGMFQGAKALRLRNWDRFPVDAADVDAVVVTHAHVDHSGHLPVLVREGYAGGVHVTPATAALLSIVLPDAAHLQEEEARYANRKGYSRHSPARPLFDSADAERALDRLVETPFATTIDIASGVRATFGRAGHILGAAWVLLEVDGGPRVVFSGDVGRSVHPLLLPPDPPPAAETVLVESTYGDRRHLDEDVTELLADAIRRTAGRGGTVLIPAFAVDRTEVVLYHLADLTRSGRIPKLPIVVDSPMALAALQVYRDAIRAGSPELRPGLDPDGPGGPLDPFDVGNVHEARTVEESVAASRRRYPSIIVSASGMATGGRILHHLSQRLEDPRNTVVLAGFQAAGTRGRSLLDGAREVKMLGRYVSVRAEIVDATGLSTHADQDELLDWLRGAPIAPVSTYVVHGEEHSSFELRSEIEHRLGRLAVVPALDEIVRVDPRHDATAAATADYFPHRMR